jgi:hypothetical protein
MATTYKNLAPTDYDNVIVFDLLSADERKKHDISGKLKNVFEAKGMPVVLIKNLGTGQELETAMQDLLNQAKNGKKFIFHFVAHGNDECIGFKHTGEQVKWEVLGKVLSEINEAAENTLVLNMTTCLGLHGIKSVDFSTSGNPFFGLIGYSDTLPISTGIKANEIFYGHVIDGKQINEAVRLLQNEMNDDKFLCITSQGYNNLKNKTK